MNEITAMLIAPLNRSMPVDELIPAKKSMWPAKPCGILPTTATPMRNSTQFNESIANAGIKFHQNKTQCTSWLRRQLPQHISNPTNTSNIERHGVRADYSTNIFKSSVFACAKRTGAAARARHSGEIALAGLRQRQSFSRTLLS
jgi:hypothetical protein